MQPSDTFDELSIHCKEHRSYSCDICYTGFVSEPLLVEHRVNDHPQGWPAWSEHTTTPRADTPEITITKEVDPEVEKAMEVVHTPDPDPFADKWHPAIGHVRKDDKHKIECEVCHRYLKTFDLRVEHVKTFHPTVFYDCVFCPRCCILHTPGFAFTLQGKPLCMSSMRQCAQWPELTQGAHGHRTSRTSSNSSTRRFGRRFMTRFHMW